MVDRLTSQGAANPEHGQKAGFLVSAFDVAHMVAVYAGQISQPLLRQTRLGAQPTQRIPEGNVGFYGLFVRVLFHTRRLWTVGAMFYRR